MKPGNAKEGGARGGVTVEQVLVITPSLLLRKRLEQALESRGFRSQSMNHVREFLRSRRQRPFLGCFLDVRNADEREVLATCFKARPSERYILIRDSWKGRNGGGKGAPTPEVFGYLREHFSVDEVEAWCRRAATEARLQQGDQSLDDLLYDRFRAFLQNLGPAPMTRLHDLVWERVERPLITAVMEWTGGNQSKAADILGVHRNTLRAKIRALRLEPPR